DELRLVLSAPGGGPGGGAAMPDGTLPAPGGWNRFALEVDDLDAVVERAAQRRHPVPQRHRRWGGRSPDPHRGPVGQPRRAVPANHRRGSTDVARRACDGASSGVDSGQDSAAVASASAASSSASRSSPSTWASRSASASLTTRTASPAG